LPREIQIRLRRLLALLHKAVKQHHPALMHDEDHARDPLAADVRPDLIS
jgi:hypothetical protein